MEKNLELSDASLINHFGNRLLGKANIRHNVYFVSARSGVGDDDNAGTDPDAPLATLEAAYLKCTANRGDYIFALDFWEASAPPLTIAKADIHLIGMGSGNFDAGNDITTDENNTAAVQIEDAGYDFEMAGFNLSSTGTNGVALEMGEGYRLHIHHCTFGCNLACVTGIAAMAGGGSFTHSTIHDCLFGTLLTGNSMYVPLNTSIVRNNRFLPVGGIAISVPVIFVNTIVEYNRFIIADSAHGEAISILPAASAGNMLDENVAMKGTGSSFAKNPFRDTATVKSAWGRNYRGRATITPLTA